MPRHIVIPVDPSEHATAAFEWALENSVLPGDTVHLLNIAEQALSRSALRSAHLGGTSASEISHINNAIIAQSAATLESFAKVCRERGVNCTSTTRQGDARKEICSFAEEVNAAMIVMGSRGLGALKRMVLGSVSSYVVSHASMPVIIYRSKDD